METQTLRAYEFTVLDAETKKPIAGIPVSCSQPGSKWDAQANNTNDSGVVVFDGLIPLEFAQFAINYGGYFHYLQGERMSVTVFDNDDLNKKTVYLIRGETKHTVGSSPNTLCEA